LLPSIATIVVAGDVDPADLARQFNDRLPSVPAGKSTGLAPLPPFLEARRRLILLDRPGAAQAVVRVGHLGVTRSEPGFEHILILNQILGGQFSSRLNAKLREERGFTYGARSHFDCRRQPGPFSITSSIQVDRLAAALTDLRDEVIAITDDKPPTQAELDSARRALIEGHARHFETPSALVNRCANLVIHDLPVEHEAGFADRLLSIDLKTLSAEARRHINPEALIFIVVADADVVADGLEQLDWAPLEIIEG
jgi:predicted Zn-dependent peptidase